MNHIALALSIFAVLCAFVGVLGFLNDHAVEGVLWIILSMLTHILQVLLSISSKLDKR